MTNTNEVATMIIKAIDREVGRHSAVIAKLAEDLAKDPLNAEYHLKWSDKAFNSSQILRLLAPLQDALAKKPERAEELAKHFIERAEDFLLGDFVGSSEGPWRHNSTSMISNLMNIEEANAHRYVRQLLVLILKEG